MAQIRPTRSFTAYGQAPSICEVLPEGGGRKYTTEVVREGVGLEPVKVDCRCRAHKLSAGKAKDQPVYAFLVDILRRDPARLAKVHRCFRKEGLPLQYSVFDVFATERELARLLTDLVTLIDLRDYDIRAYLLPARGERRLIGKQLIPEDVMLIQAGGDLMAVMNRTSDRVRPDRALHPVVGTRSKFSAFLSGAAFFVDSSSGSPGMA